jgi:hypothetical protein
VGRTCDAIGGDEERVEVTGIKAEGKETTRNTKT